MIVAQQQAVPDQHNVQVGSSGYGPPHTPQTSKDAPHTHGNQITGALFNLGPCPPLQSPTLLCGEVPGCVPPPSQQAPRIQHLHHASHPCSSPTPVRRSTRVRRPTRVRGSSKRCDSEDENCGTHGDNHEVPVLQSSSTKGFCDVFGCTNRLEGKYRCVSYRLKLCSDHLQVCLQLLAQHLSLNQVPEKGDVPSTENSPED